MRCRVVLHDVLRRRWGDAFLSLDAPLSSATAVLTPISIHHLSLSLYCLFFLATWIKKNKKKKSLQVLFCTFLSLVARGCVFQLKGTRIESATRVRKASLPLLSIRVITEEPEGKREIGESKSTLSILFAF